MIRKLTAQGSSSANLVAARFPARQQSAAQRMTGDSLDPNVNLGKAPPAAVSFQSSHRVEAVEKSAAELLIGEGVEGQMRDKLLRDLGKLPAAALSKLRDEGWSIRLADYPRHLDGTKVGGQCRPLEKIVELERTVYHNDKEGKLLLHELAHALDFKGCQASGLVEKAMGLAHGQPFMGTDKNAAFCSLYEQFQCQQTISLGWEALKLWQNSHPGATRVAFSTLFGGAMQASFTSGALVVTTSQEAVKQSRFTRAEPAPEELPKVVNINGVRVVRQKALTLVKQEAAAALSTSWTPLAAYVASSSRPSELFAEGMAAYLSSPDSRQALLQQSPEVHAFVEQSVNEFLIAGSR